MPRHGWTTGAGLAVVLVAASPCRSSAEPDDAPALPARPASPPQASTGHGGEPTATTGTQDLVVRVDVPRTRVAWPPTQLPLTVLTTLDDPADENDRATVRDADSGVIASYRAGDQIRDGLIVLSIADGIVELSNDGEVEYLSVSPVPFELDPQDVFYPDLIDDLGTELGDGVQMPKGTSYIVKRPGNAWGTPRTVALLRDAIRTYARENQGPKVRVGDISLPGGGPFPPHLSHQEGRDVDVGYVLRGAKKNERYFHPATADNLDLPRTWALLEALLATNEVGYVFMDYELQKLLYAHAEGAGVGSERLAELFQYPRGRRASRGVIRHWKGHRGHFHVRFRR